MPDLATHPDKHHEHRGHNRDPLDQILDRIEDAARRFLVDQRIPAAIDLGEALLTADAAIAAAITATVERAQPETELRQLVSTLTAQAREKMQATY